MLLSRRELMVGAALGGAALTISGQTGRSFGSDLKVRRDVNTLSADDPIMEAYRAAITTMHERDSADERSWIGQARIHLDHCHHQSRHFLPWHRFYIKAFEDIVADLSGFGGFALPYWDWTTNPQIPLAFFDQGSALDTQKWNDDDPLVGSTARILTAADTLDSGDVDIAPFKDQKLFPVFSSRLESGPHGSVHVAVGGHMLRFLSPLDPIFWLHHCNVDRIWADWNARKFKNPTDDAWLDEPFDDMFAGTDGRLMSGLTARGALTTEGMGYMYDRQVPQTVASPAEPMRFQDLLEAFQASPVAAANEIPSIVNVPTSVPLKASAETLLPATVFDKMAARAGRLDKQILLRLSDIRIPDNAEGYEIRVFLNCDYLSRTTPINDPHFVGTFNLFGLREAHRHEGHNDDVGVLFDLTETLVNLNLRQTPVQDGLNVQFMPVPTGNMKVTGEEFRVGRIEVTSV